MDMRHLQDMLDRICVSFMEQDFPAWEACVQLPFTLVVRTGSMTFATAESLRANFLGCSDHAASAGIDQMIRTALSVVDCEDGTALGTFRTELLRHGYRVYQPYTSSGLFLSTPEGWKLSSILNARNAPDWIEVDPTHSAPTA